MMRSQICPHHLVVRDGLNLGCDLPHGLRPFTLGRERGVRRAGNAKFLKALLNPPPLKDPPRDLDDLLRVDLAKRDAVNDLLRLR